MHSFSLDYYKLFLSLTIQTDQIFYFLSEYILVTKFFCINDTYPDT